VSQFAGMMVDGHSNKPLKIALVSPYDFPFPGGVTNHITNLSQQFRSAGHEVHILAPSSDDDAERNIPHFHRIGKTIVPMRSNASVARLTFSLTLGRSVKRLLADADFDVIHIHEPMVPLLPWYVLRQSKNSNALKIGTFHASRDTTTVYRTYKPVLRKLIRMLDGRIAVSNAARNFVGRSFRGDYRVIPNGIDAKRYGRNVPPMPKIPAASFNVLFVGRLEKRKGLSYLLEAMSTVQRLRDNSSLTIVGAFTNRQLQKAKRMVRGHGLRNVRFQGFVSEEDKLRYYKSADVFCAPAIGGRESQGLVLLEAMAAGTPVIASDLPGYRSLSPDGRAALFVAPEDPRALARAILRLMTYPHRAAQLRTEGLRAAEAFSWDGVAARVLDFYRELLDRRGGAGRPALMPATASRAE
ncbi:MAG: glycosyltransferase family 4 protein, partial [Chloroflexi bacterium]|nr:glycosyltransferase family 4 protein [Chloroflexota bacterium]